MNVAGIKAESPNKSVPIDLKPYWFKMTGWIKIYLPVNWTGIRFLLLIWPRGSRAMLTSKKTFLFETRILETCCYGRWFLNFRNSRNSTCSHGRCSYFFSLYSWSDSRASLGMLSNSSSQIMGLLLGAYAPQVPSSTFQVPSFTPTPEYVCRYVGM